MAQETGYRNHAAKGVGWSSGGRIVSQAISIASTAILARILEPADFGLIGMATIYLGFIVMYRELGLATAIVREDDPSHRLLSSIFWSNFLLTGVIVGITWAVAPFVSNYFREPRLTLILRVQSLGLAFSSIGMVQSALLWRRMAFRELVLIDIGTAFVGFVVSVSGALAGWGVWALVASSLVTAVASATLLCGVMRFRPMLTLCPEDIRKVAGFSLNLTGFNTVNYFARNGDNMLVGRYLGATPLAFYALGYNLMLFPIQNVTQVLGRTLFPAFSAIQHDNARFRSAYLRSCSVIAAITFPMMAGVSVTSDLLIGSVYGHKWMPAAPVLAILAPVGLVQSVTSIVGQIYTAKGRTDWLMWWGLGSSAFLIGAFLIGLHWGVNGVAAAYAIGIAVILYPCLRIPFSLIDLKVRDFVKSLAPVMACSCGMVLVVCATRAVLAVTGVTNVRAQLFSAVAAGIISYAALMLAGKPAVTLEIVDLLARLRVPGVKAITRGLGFPAHAPATAD